MGTSSEMSGQPRFPIPYDFKPNLSFVEALVAIAASLCRIILGCLLFAVWAVCTLQTWNAIHGGIWRAFALILAIVVFVVLFAALLIAISAAAKKLGPSPRRSL
jgi:hypothetical protein